MSHQVHSPKPRWFNTIQETNPLPNPFGRWKNWLLEGELMVKVGGEVGIYPVGVPFIAIFHHAIQHPQKKQIQEIFHVFFKT